MCLAILTPRTWPIETIQISNVLLGRPRKGWWGLLQEILVPSQAMIPCLPSYPWYVEWNHQWYCHSQWPQEGVGVTVSLVFRFPAFKGGFPHIPMHSTHSTPFYFNPCHVISCQKGRDKYFYLRWQMLLAGWFYYLSSS